MRIHRLVSFEMINIKTTSSLETREKFSCANGQEIIRLPEVSTGF